MQILSTSEVDKFEILARFGNADWKSLILSVGFVLTALTFLITSWVIFDGNEWPIHLAYLVCCLLLIVLLIYAITIFYLNPLKKSWRIKQLQEGLCLNFTTGQYFYSSANSPYCALISSDNIDWIRKIQSSTGNSGLEIGLKKREFSHLREALKTAYYVHHSAFAIIDEPLRISDSGTLHLSIDNPDRVIKVLKNQYPVLQSGFTRCKHFNNMSQEEKRDHIDALICEGDKKGAIKASQETYGFSYMEAKSHIKSRTNTHK